VSRASASNATRENYTVNGGTAVFPAEIFHLVFVSAVLMSADYKKSTGATVILIILGLTALFAGARWLTLLIPVAVLVWFSAVSAWRTGRN
jgi:hypothetical protein